MAPADWCAQVEKLCLNYGPRIGQIDQVVFHDFPSPGALTGPDVESHLRALGFGYRARYLAQTALIVAHDRPRNWLQELSNPTPTISPSTIPPGGRPGYREAHAALLDLQGVGPKVADCVCLMGLGWGESVPVDTHVWQIAVRDYRFGKGRHKSLTKATYDAVGDYFRGLWGVEAGWAHSVLFAADLKTFEGKVAVEVKGEGEVLVKMEAVGEADGIGEVRSEKSMKREVDRDVAVKSEINDEEIAIKLESSRSQRASKRRKI